MAGELPVGCECDKDVVPAREVHREGCRCPAAGSRLPRWLPLRPTAEKVKLAADALFEFDKAVLLPEGKAKLDELAAKAKSSSWKSSWPSATPTASVPMPTTRSCPRSALPPSRTYLVGKGVEANRVYTEGKGEKQPVTGDKCTTSARIPARTRSSRVPAAGPSRGNRSDRHQVIAGVGASPQKALPGRAFCFSAGALSPYNLVPALQGPSNAITP
jgi:hypothetical protein